MSGGGGGGSGGGDSDIGAISMDQAQAQDVATALGLDQGGVAPAQEATAAPSLSGVDQALGADDPGQGISTGVANSSNQTALSVAAAIGLGAITGGVPGAAIAAIGQGAQAIAGTMGIDLSIAGMAQAMGINLDSIDMAGSPSSMATQGTDSSVWGDSPGAGSAASVLSQPAAPGAAPAAAQTPAARATAAASAAERARLVEIEAENERERVAMLGEEEKRKAAAAIASGRFSFGELNLTGPFGLKDSPVSVFRPVASPVQKYQLGA